MRDWERIPSLIGQKYRGKGQKFVANLFEQTSSEIKKALDDIDKILSGQKP